MFAACPSAFWLTPERWEGIDPRKEVFRMRDPIAMLGHLAGPRRVVAETTYGRVLTPPAPPPPMIAKVVDPKDMFR